MGLHQVDRVSLHVRLLNQTNIVYLQMRNMFRYVFVLVPCLAFMLSGCKDNRVYEFNYIMSQNNWYIDTVPTFTFNIDEPQKQYNVLLNIRNTIAYPYYNLFVKYQLCDSIGNKLQGQQVEMMLLDAKTGRPQGSGIGDLYFHQFPVLTKYQFPYKGKFKVKIIQYMRANPLPEIMSAGVRIEEVLQ